MSAEVDLSADIADRRARAAGWQSLADQYFDAQWDKKRLDEEFFQACIYSLRAKRLRLEAALAERNGIAAFLSLFTLDGQYVGQVLEPGAFGWRWQIQPGLHEQKIYVPADRRQRKTYVKYGYLPGIAEFPAKISTVPDNENPLGIQPAVVKACGAYDLPLRVVSVDIMESGWIPIDAMVHNRLDQAVSFTY